MQILLSQCPECALTNVVARIAQCGLEHRHVGAATEMAQPPCRRRANFVALVALECFGERRRDVFRSPHAGKRPCGHLTHLWRVVDTQPLEQQGHAVAMTLERPRRRLADVGIFVGAKDAAKQCRVHLLACAHSDAFDPEPRKLVGALPVLHRGLRRAVLTRHVHLHRRSWSRTRRRS